LTIALVPSYNNEHTIAKVVLKAKKHVDLVIVYDDGSSDLTFDIAKAVGAEVIKGEVNKGKGFAMKRLFEKSKTHVPQLAVTLDGDDQHDADDIPQLLLPLIRGECDVAVGQRTGLSWPRRIGGKFLNLFSSRELDVQSGFRAYSWKALQQIEVTTNGYGVDQQILDNLKKKGLRIKQIPVTTKYDEYSHTKNPLSHFYQVFNYIFLRKPLLHLGITGLLAFFSGVCGLVQIVHIYGIKQELALGTLLLSITILLLGALTFFVGLILHVLKTRKED